MRFIECASCAAKPGSPTLCASCVANRAEISRLTAELDAERRRNEALRRGLVSGAHDAACLESRLKGLITQLGHTDGVPSGE